MLRRVALLTLAMIAVASVAAGMQPLQPGVTTVAVPAGNGAPVITDGQFDPGEWDDALRIGLDESIALYLKEYRGVVFIGVRGSSGDLGPSELSLAGENGPIRKLHVSAQLFEVELPPTGPEPPSRPGFTTGWYANEFRRDMALSARLEKEGKDPMAIIRAASYPSDGIEFAILRSKIPGQRWRMRLWATGFFSGRPGTLVYPPAAAERETGGWLELRLGSKSAPPSPEGEVAASERAAVEQTVRDAIGWALTKDRARLESIVAHDAGLFIFHPDSRSTTRGYEAFAKKIPDFMDPRFKATHFEVKELTTTWSRSGAVAWYSAMLDDCGEWDGKPSCWRDTRWTGVLEKREGRWVIVQMHFSFAKDKVLLDCPAAPKQPTPDA